MSVRCVGYPSGEGTHLRELAVVGAQVGESRPTSDASPDVARRPPSVLVWLRPMQDEVADAGSEPVSGREADAVSRPREQDGRLRQVHRGAMSSCRLGAR